MAVADDIGEDTEANFFGVELADGGREGDERRPVVELVDGGRHPVAVFEVGQMSVAEDDQLVPVDAVALAEVR